MMLRRRDTRHAFLRAVLLPMFSLLLSLLRFVYYAAMMPPAADFRRLRYNTLFAIRC